MNMANNKINLTLKKFEQYEHRKVLRENRIKVDKNKIDLQRKIIIGEIFLKHFPIALEFTPDKLSKKNKLILEQLDDFIEALSKCQQAYQTIEDTLLR